MTTERQMRADKVTVLAGLAANPHFTALDFDDRFTIYAEVMALVTDVHDDHQDSEPTEPTARQAFDWATTLQAVIDTGVAFRRDYPSKNTAQTTTSKLKTKYADKPVRIHSIESEVGGGTIIVTSRLG